MVLVLCLAYFIQLQVFQAHCVVAYRRISFFLKGFSELMQGFVIFC